VLIGANKQIARGRLGPARKLMRIQEAQNFGGFFGLLGEIGLLFQRLSGHGYHSSVTKEPTFESFVTRQMRLNAPSR
jgi:hypothetical protein